MKAVFHLPPAEDRVRYFLTRKLDDAGIPWWFEATTRATQGKLCRIDLLILCRPPISRYVGIGEVLAIVETKSAEFKQDARERAKQLADEQEQLERLSSLGYPLYVCRGMKDVNKTFNTVRRLFDWHTTVNSVMEA